MITLVVGEPLYFRNFTWDKADEFVNDHPDGQVRKHASRVIMTCTELHLRNRCKVQDAYYRVTTPQGLRGIAGPVEVTWQNGYKPNSLQYIYDAIQVINGKDGASWLSREKRRA